jgi:1-acyl-sn-glycerol-3-phosphate acyltransferase
LNPYFVVFIRTLSKIALRVMGFTVKGNLPEGLKKFVVIGAPHTANIDFVLALSWLQFKDVRPLYLAKETVFYPPYGWFFRMIGGISDNRKRRQKGEKSDSVIDIVVNEFEKHDNIVFGIMPEGGRRLVKRWKTGFYQIAVRAKVPIVITTFDYAKKEITHAAVFHPTGDLEHDMPIILSYYKNVTAKNPEKFVLDERYV